MAISTALITGGVILAAIIVAPFALPSSKTVERTATINADQETLYAMIASPRGYQKFNPYHDTDPDLKIEFLDIEQGIGAGFSFKGKEGKGTQTVTALEENKKVTMLIDLGSMGKPVQTFTLSPVENGTQVVWSTKSEFGMNPIGRVFGLFLDSMLGETYERGLRNLEKAATSTA
ncbi:MAG: SRPBCC family protein [Pseudomonadota bacterium]